MPVEVGARFVRVRVRDPRRFRKGSFRTLRVGSHRVIIGHLKTNHTGRAHVQAVLHPAREFFPGCRGCAVARRRGS